MKQVHFCGKVRIIGKGAERVDCGMYDDTGQQTSAAIKYRDQQESNRNRKNDLTQVIHKIHTAAVEKVDNMSDAESYARDDNGGFDIILCKTQSRFTRELELVEKYIHGLFPIWGIRFISIVDNADTANKGNKKSRQINGLVNEW